MNSTLIAEGAEAKIFKKGSTRITKERIEKPYRHPELDKKIRKGRNKREAKILVKAKEQDVNVPTVNNINKKNEPTDEVTLTIEFIDGDKLADTLNDYPEKKQYDIMEKLGAEIAKLHDADIVHGDLTTSNTLLKEENVFIIDFGLGYFSRKIEDKAVDLHVLKQALEAKHWQHYETLFEHFLKGYKPEEQEKILERLVAVERRGRYKKGS